MSEKIEPYFTEDPTKEEQMPSVIEIMQFRFSADNNAFRHQMEHAICAAIGVRPKDLYLTGADIRKCFRLNAAFLN